ncbi:MAG: CRISPR-associated DxTHG motif protein, partial [Candidatus Fervidibacter sp.]
MKTSAHAFRSLPLIVFTVAVYLR